jgi:uncharacterized lipoprotein YajG
VHLGATGYDIGDILSDILSDILCDMLDENEAQDVAKGAKGE